MVCQFHSYIPSQYVSIAKASSRGNLVISDLKLIAEKHSPKIRKALLKSFDEIRNKAKLSKVLNAFKTGGLSQALKLIDGMEDILSKNVLTELSDAVSNSGKAGVQFFNSVGATTNAMFNLVNPKTGFALHQHGLRLIREIAGETRKAVMNHVQASLIAGQNPTAMARGFRDTIGLTTKQELAVRNFKGYLETANPQALKRKLRDRRFDNTIKQILDGKNVGSTKIDQMVNRYRQRFVKYRAETIARTESLRAISMGEYEGLRQAQEQGKVDDRLRRFWIFTQDSRTRVTHIGVPGLNPKGVRVNEAFQTNLGQLLYPRDPNGLAANTVNCRCSVVYRLDESQPSASVQSQFKEVKQPISSVITKPKKETFTRFRKEEDMRRFGESLNSKLQTTGDEHFISVHYKKTGYMAINKHLRTGQELPEGVTVQNINTLSGLIDKSSLPKNITTFRGAGSEGITLANQLKIGDQFLDKSFVSTSMNFENSLSYSGFSFDDPRIIGRKIKTIFQYNLKKGQKSLYLQGEKLLGKELADLYEDEFEILLKPNQKFKVIDIKERKIKNNKVRTVVLEME